ncbi:MAG: hypothetical protein IT345_07030 [Trueperaceae bacterium]|nr:hypothetical protein [Trueperaceae bacterium]
MSTPSEGGRRGVADLAPFGQDAALAVLRRLLGSSAGPRSLLLAGPEHVGRRQAARWLCAFSNCSAPDSGPRPCGECESCRLALAGMHPDLKEVGPATTTEAGRAKRNLEIRIDQLVPREGGDPEPLAPWLTTRPRYRTRVGLIDHADALNTSAANAFLKVLEEPPPWALIVLVAPGPEALLPTVASRCVTVRFAAVDDALARLGETGAPVATADLSGHPGVRLGQPGALLRALEDADATAAARSASSELIAALPGDVLTAMQAAEAFAKAVAASMEAGQEPGPLGWLREALRSLPAAQYAAALDALDACERAIAAYAQVPLACSVLALELRRLTLDRR